MTVLDYLGAFLVAYLTSAAVQPLVIRYAVDRRLLDMPDSHRRGHARPIPRLGGVGVFAGITVAAVAAVLLGAPAGDARITPLTEAILASCAILFLVGLLDDLRGVPPLWKILAQASAAAVVYSAGFRIETISLPPDYQLALGWLAFPVTVVWLVGLSNAFNLVDGLDGLAGGIAVIALLASAATAGIVGNDSTVLRCVGLLGAVIGFLRYNFPPARIFLGDSGSLVVGFLLGVLTVKGATRADGATVALAPIFALAYPLLDTGISIMRRWLRGEPLSRADGRHIHHQLCKLGLGPRQAVLFIYAGALAVAWLGLSATFASPQLTLAIGILGAGVLLFVLVYGARWLQYHEFLEVGAALRDVGPRGRQVLRDKIQARDVAALILAAPSLDHVNRILAERSRDFRFAHVAARGRWSRRPQSDAAVHVELFQQRRWRVEYPVSTTREHPASSLLLDIWCSMDDGGNPANAERVARILATAIETWAASQPTHPWHQPPMMTSSTLLSHDAPADVHLQA